MREVGKPCGSYRYQESNVTPEGSGYWGEGWVHIQQIRVPLGCEGGGGYGASMGVVEHPRKGRVHRRAQRHLKRIWDTQEAGTTQ